MTSQAFSIQRRVQFAETDVAGVMHFSNYFRLMEEVEHAWWRSLGISVYADGESAEFFVAARGGELRVRRAARFEDVLELRHHVTGMSAKSLQHEVEFWRSDKRIAVGKMTTVCCAATPEGFRSIPIPAEVLEKLKSGGRAAG